MIQVYRGATLLPVAMIQVMTWIMCMTLRRGERGWLGRGERGWLGRGERGWLGRGERGWLGRGEGAAS
jgi:hypothetical protein